MIDREAFADFRQGLALLRADNATEASVFLRKAFDRDPENAYYASYYGLSLGHAEGLWAQAERLCHLASCRGRRQAQLHLNLAEVYRVTGQRQAASDALARGLHYLPLDIRLQVEYGKLAVRRKPVLKSLPRTHGINRALGRIRHQLLNYIPRRKWLTVGQSAPNRGAA